MSKVLNQSNSFMAASSLWPGKEVLLYGMLFFHIVEVFGFSIGYIGEFEIFKTEIF